MRALPIVAICLIFGFAMWFLGYILQLGYHSGFNPDPNTRDHSETAVHLLSASRTPSTNQVTGRNCHPTPSKGCVFASSPPPPVRKRTTNPLLQNTFLLCRTTLSRSHHNCFPNNCFRNNCFRNDCSRNNCFRNNCSQSNNLTASSRSAKPHSRPCSQLRSSTHLAEI
jgi:hypothetical protein